MSGIYIGDDQAELYGTNTASVTWHHPASQNGSREELKDGRMEAWQDRSIRKKECPFTDTAL